ncbi:uncharacterized protein LOC132299350 [Cornus florida]|uniref:uncharacterized protein LOC132299350 n=1 Tax=Cornus florida TaxID=4283 RepID=UPI00289A1DC3|nr:uncharacterized protein LOC132299350 [Cornus florida]XP_059651873.1 uncharacterized protein LOC132299350 [Cornus florida]XP_059651874.1 uncharacterized protein LOC132299350 [Cornus florida]XP_059651875.1 uncharacterized protein LOC132299350 [Cornus florida]XP_059651876.1 uncharacterized protein LOC132299350 [Cornus florida]
METDNVPEAGPKKALAQKQEKPSSGLKDEDDNDEILQLKERLESSPDQSEVMETEVPQVQADVVAKKKHLSASYYSATEISSDEDFEVEVATTAEKIKRRVGESQQMPNQPNPQ